MEWRTTNGSASWFCKCKIGISNLVILLYLLFPFNAFSLDFTFFDKECSQLVSNIDNDTITEEEASFIVGYLSVAESSKLSEDDFADILTYIYSKCKQKPTSTIGETLDNVLAQINPQK